MIFTLDEDPIFEQTIITLFRLVKKNEAIKVYQETGDLLYHDFLLEKKRLQYWYRFKTYKNEGKGASKTTISSKVKNLN